MGLRQTLNENPVVTTILTIVIMVSALVYIGYRFTSHGSTPKIPTTSYYSDDDGKTWYIDDAKNIPPYDHNGKMAYRAWLFKGEDGKPFVSRLEGFDSDTKANIAKEMSNGRAPLSAQWRFTRGMMVKRPGDAKWVQMNPTDPDSIRQWSEIMKPVAPDGSKRVRPVSVEEDAKP